MASEEACSAAPILAPRSLARSSSCAAHASQPSSHSVVLNDTSTTPGSMHLVQRLALDVSLLCGISAGAAVVGAGAHMHKPTSIFFRISASIRSHMWGQERASWGGGQHMQGCTYHAKGESQHRKLPASSTEGNRHYIWACEVPR